MGYIIAVASAVLLALSAVLFFAISHINTQKADNASLTLRLGGCQAQTTNITEDKDSDHAIDVLPMTTCALLLLNGCGTPQLAASTKAQFCDVEESRKFAQAELDWRAKHVP